MECPTCLRYWNPDTCVPKSLSCGHSFCEQCLDALFAKQKNGILCPICQTLNKMTAGELQTIPKNYSLLTLIRGKIMAARQPPAPASGLQLSGQRGSAPSSAVLAHEAAEREAVEKAATVKPFCDRHKLPVHSYIPGTTQLLCDKCIPEVAKLAKEVRPIQKVCHEFRQQISKTQNALTFRKSEIRRYKAVLSYIADTSRKEAETAVAEYYQKMAAVLAESEKRTREKLGALCDSQQKLVSSYSKLLDDSYDRLVDLEVEARTIAESDDAELSRMSKRIETVGLKVSGTKRLELPSDSLCLRAHIDPGIYGKLAPVFDAQIRLDATPVLAGNRPVTVNEYAVPVAHWLCTVCGAVTPDAQLQCTKCSTFRSIESFPNLLDNPQAVTEAEVKMLRLRRQQEKILIWGRDLLNSQVLDMDTCWYLISSEWLAEWKAFIFNKPCRTSRVSPNPAVGVLPPGPISNYVFFMKDKQTLKDSLQKDTDYRGVNEFVWEAYARIYGGGPVIVRSEIEIYALPSANPRLLEAAADVNYYRNFERTHKEILDELVKLKKMEREEGKEAAVEESYKKLRAMAEKTRKANAAQVRQSSPIKVESEVKKEEKAEEKEEDATVIQNLFSLFRK